MELSPLKCFFIYLDITSRLIIVLRKKFNDLLFPFLSLISTPNSKQIKETILEKNIDLLDRSSRFNFECLYPNNRLKYRDEIKSDFNGMIFSVS